MALAGALLELDQPRRALDELAAAEADLPDSAELHYRRALALQAVGDAAGAERALARFADLDERRQSADASARSLGIALNEAQELASGNKLPEALANLESMRAEHPKFAPIRALLAKVLFSMRRPEEALVEITEARELEPGRTEYHYLEAMFAAQLGRWEAAELAAERALALDGSLAEARRLRDEARRRRVEVTEAAGAAVTPGALRSHTLLALLVWPASGLAGELAFVERAAELGVTFEHRHFGEGDKRMPENMAPGVVVFDADADGWLDLYFVQGAPWPGAPSAVEASNRLFRGRGEGRFEDATTAGVTDSAGYGMGAAFGDVDRDGDADLYVTNFGPNRLLQNVGGGRFEVDPQPAVAGTEWSSAAGFFDPDGDGDLDLFVVNYLDFDPAENKWCGNAQRKLRSYCHPDVYDGAPDRFLRNRGDGSFVDATGAAGLKSTVNDKGLGLALVDLDGDGLQDAYVANDSTMNYLYLGRDGGRFEERGLLAGAAVNGTGATEASMGVAVGDLNGDALPELFVTHLDQETNTLYRSRGSGRFADATVAAGLAAPGLPWVGFGTAFFDADNDGDLDLFVANGHIIDNIELFDATRSYRQPAQLFENVGDGRFVERSEKLGLDGPIVGRGAVPADLDRDGDLDLVVTQNNARALVLLNRGSDGVPSLAVRLRGVRSNPHGFGARLELTTDRGRQVRWMTSASSYLSQGPAEVHFGLGEAGVQELKIFWPSGQIDRHRGLEPGAIYTLTEGESQVDRRPLSGRDLASGS